MNDAARVLAVGGVLQLAYGFLTGFVLSAIRTRKAQAPRYLMLAHVGPLMQGPILLGLIVALPFAHLSPRMALLGAWLLVSGAALLSFKDTLHWLQSVRDEFAERPIGFYLGGLSSVASTAGLGIFVFGVLRGI